MHTSNPRILALLISLCAVITAMGQAPEVIRTQPEGTLRTYLREGKAFFAYYGEATMTTQHGTVIDVVTAPDGRTVYMKNPMSQAPTGTWVRGSIGEDDKIHVPLGQCVQYFDMGYGWQTCVLKMLSYDEQNGAQYYIADLMQEITFSISPDGSTISMDSLDGPEDQGGFPGAMYALIYTDDFSFVGYADYESVYSPYNMGITTIPEGLKQEPWTFTYSNAREGESEQLPVAQEGDKLYVAGLSIDDPEAAVVGTIEGNSVSFASDQYVGYHSGFLLYAFGATYETSTYYDEEWDESFTTNKMTPQSTFSFAFDPTTRTLTSTPAPTESTGTALVLNMGKVSELGINYMSVALDPVLQAPEGSEILTPTGITAPTTLPSHPTCYDLSGRLIPTHQMRRQTAPATQGITIFRTSNGKVMKVLSK